MADINLRVTEGDTQGTLQALQAACAGLRGVMAECADDYQSELGKQQALNAAEGTTASVMLLHLH